MTRPFIRGSPQRAPAPRLSRSHARVPERRCRQVLRVRAGHADVAAASRSSACPRGLDLGMMGPMSSSPPPSWIEPLEPAPGLDQEALRADFVRKLNYDLAKFQPISTRNDHYL